MRFAVCDDDSQYALKFSEEFTGVYNERMGTSGKLEWIYYTNGDALIEQYEGSNIDIIFMDIEIGEASGFDIARRLHSIDKNVAICYMTNHDNYINQAFVCRPLGFIRKNNPEMDMRMASYEICEYLNEKNRKLVIKKGIQSVELILNDIYAVEVYNHQLVFSYEDKSITVRANLSRYESELAEAGYIKISRGRMVNSRHIKYIEKRTVYLYSGYNFEISEDKVSEVLKKWMELR